MRRAFAVLVMAICAPCSSPTKAPLVDMESLDVTVDASGDLPDLPTFVLEGSHGVTVRAVESTCGDWVAELVQAMPERLDVPDLGEAVSVPMDIAFRDPLGPVSGVPVSRDGDGLVSDGFPFAGVLLGECVADLWLTLSVDGNGAGALMVEPDGCPATCEAVLLFDLSS